MPFVVSSLRALLSSFDMSLSLLISVCSYSAYACDRGFRVLPYQRWRNRKLQKFCLLPVTLDQHVRSASSSVSSAEGSLSHHPLSAHQSLNIWLYFSQFLRGSSVFKNELRKSASFKKQLMFKDKYSSILFGQTWSLHFMVEYEGSFFCATFRCEFVMK